LKAPLYKFGGRSVKRVVGIEDLLGSTPALRERAPRLAVAKRRKRERQGSLTLQSKLRVKVYYRLPSSFVALAGVAG
jgi:hypothetical protein